MKINKKLYLRLILTLAIISIIFSLNGVSVLASELENNIEVDFHSVSVIRNGYVFPASVTIRNIDENVVLDIKKVTILNDKNKIVKTKNIDKDIKALKNSARRYGELISYLRLPEFSEKSGSIEQQQVIQIYF